MTKRGACDVGGSAVFHSRSVPGFDLGGRFSTFPHLTGGEPCLATCTSASVAALMSQAASSHRDGRRPQPPRLRCLRARSATGARAHCRAPRRPARHRESARAADATSHKTPPS